MAVFDHIPAGEAGLQEVYQWVDGLVAANENVARKEIIGKSEEGREIPAVFHHRSERSGFQQRDRDHNPRPGMARKLEPGWWDLKS